jgi:hypothetical protein
MFEPLVPFIHQNLTKHHELYSRQCKAEYWEEIFALSLKQSGFGSTWKPDFNHKSGVDQTMDNGIRISNKGGSIIKNIISFSGSRLTKYKTLNEKLEFLSDKKEDYVLCLATDKDEWKKGSKRYYFVVINSDTLNYHEQEWEETYGKQTNIGQLTGWKCSSEVFNAKIIRSNSDQLWTEMKLDYYEEFYEITIG